MYISRRNSSFPSLFRFSVYDQKTKGIEHNLFPTEGSPPEDILRELEERRWEDIRWKQGKVKSLVYYLNDEHNELLQKTYTSYFSENYLNAFAFPGLKEMEAEVLSITAQMVHNPHAVGTMSSGGTESIILAMFTYREWAQHKHKNRKRKKDPGTCQGSPCIRKSGPSARPRAV